MPFDVFSAKPPADCVVVLTPGLFAIREGGTWRSSPTFGELTVGDIDELFDPVRDTKESARLVSEARAALASAANRSTNAGTQKLTAEEIRHAIFCGLRLAWLDRLSTFQGRKEIRGEPPLPPPSGPATVVQLPTPGPTTSSMPVLPLFSPGRKRLTPEEMLALTLEQQAEEANSPNNPKVPTPFPDEDVASKLAVASKAPTVYVAKPHADWVVVLTEDWFATRESGIWRLRATFGGISLESLCETLDLVSDPVEAARLIEEARAALFPRT